MAKKRTRKKRESAPVVSPASAAAEVPHVDTPDTPPLDMRGAGFIAMGLALVVFAACVAFVFLYARAGSAILARMDTALGETLMEQGIRYEDAREFENAIQTYRQALETRFDGPQNRTFTLKRLGALLLWREGAEAALPYLEECYRGVSRPITVFEPLCMALLETGRLDEALAKAIEWYREAEAQNLTTHQAQAKYHEGRIHLARGDKTSALGAFRAGAALEPPGLNAYEAGVLLFDEGRAQEALPYLEAFLTRGTGARARYAEDLLRRIRERR